MKATEKNKKKSKILYPSPNGARNVRSLLVFVCSSPIMLIAWEKKRAKKYIERNEEENK